jgi:hypothetical protein
MLAMAVNDNALNQIPRGALWFFASRLASTGRQPRLFSVCSMPPQPPRFQPGA